MSNQIYWSQSTIRRIERGFKAVAPLSCFKVKGKIKNSSYFPNFFFEIIQKTRVIRPWD